MYASPFLGSNAFHNLIPSAQCKAPNFDIATSLPFISPLKSPAFKNYQALCLSDFSVSHPNFSLSRFYFYNTRNAGYCLSLKQGSDQAGTAENDSFDNLRVVFTAGGTGGHIYPAVAIADELRLTNPACEILFIGNSDSMESTAIPSAGYDFTSVPPVRLACPTFSLKNLSLPYHLIKSIMHCFRKLSDFEPDVIVGTGGHVSFPVCLAGKLKGIALVIHEQNSVPGTVNWILSLLADKIIVAFNSTIDSFPRNKCLACGNPVRLSLRQYVSKAKALSHFFPGSEDSEAQVLLVLAGSLAANSINIAMLNLYYRMLMQNESLFIIWQTGVEAFDEMDSLVKDHPHLYLTPFIHSMDMAYAAADLIASRAGAMTCYEILATGKPSILIPSPNVDEGHQFRNANLMADLAGCKVITEDELDSATLAIAIQEILSDKSTMAEMSERALKAAKPDASAAIAHQILSLVNLSRNKDKRQ